MATASEKKHKMEEGTECVIEQLVSERSGREKNRHSSAQRKCGALIFFWVDKFSSLKAVLISRLLKQKLLHH